MPIWSAETVQKILQEVPARWKALFWCIALTAVRLGELLALQWKDIDWDPKTITFGKTFWRGRLQDSTKTGQGHVRHMPESLERILRSISKPAKISDPTISYFVDPMMIRARMILTSKGVRAFFRSWECGAYITDLLQRQQIFRVLEVGDVDCELGNRLFQRSLRLRHKRH